MLKRIEAVFFDMGDTLRRITKTEERKIEGSRLILELLGSDLDAESFNQTLISRANRYKQWARETILELAEEDLWTQWMLPDWPADQVSKLANQLNKAWRDASATRVFYPEAREVILQLYRWGYHIGVVSNTTSKSEVPLALDQAGIAGYFEGVVLSCVFGKRKPDPAIFSFAAEMLGVRPERCAYVGNKPNMDVVSSRKAGFATTVILRDVRRPLSGLVDPELMPDHWIDNLKDLLDIFPAGDRSGKKHLIDSDGSSSGGDERPLWDASLSTMWAINNFQDLRDFIVGARRLGFGKIELNHQVNSKMLDGVEFSPHQVTGIHEPCPADISTEVYRERDWLISSNHEDNRQQGVSSIKKSIDLAREIGTRVVIVHSGSVRAGKEFEKERHLRSLFRSGEHLSEPYLEAKNRLKDIRDSLVESHIEATTKSLRELLDYAGSSGIALGLENRFHFLDIPSPAEMELFFGLADPDRLGFVFDIGHAEALERLGFYPKAGWLRRFADRILGVHFHDIIGVSDHYAPGLGDVNYDELIPYLPPNAFRTFELRPQNTFKQVKDGLELLAKKGIIPRL